MAIHARVAGAWWVIVCLCAASPAAAQPSFKVAYYNIQSGKGEPGLPGRPVLFTDTANCTDPSLPLNAWGVQFLQPHLVQAVGADHSIVALGLSEAWVCGSESNVRQLLGWRAQSTNRNGVAMIARYGFAGPEEWLELDTSGNLNAKDTMWVLRVPVCLNDICSTAIDVFTAHWYADAPATATYEQWKTLVPVTLDRQSAQTVDFVRRTGGNAPHILIGDLNTWESSVQTVCNQFTPNAGLNRLRDAGYVDAWPLLHGSAEGYTGMTNRPQCGVPEGYTWKRIDYAWSPAHFLPLSLIRFGVVNAGDPSPSDHYGIIAEFPLAGIPMPPPVPPPATIPAGADDIVLYTADAAITGNTWQQVHDTQAAGTLRLWNPDRGIGKLAGALAAPPNFVELTFTAIAGRPYRLWVRGKAENNHWTNDSMFAQFTNSVTPSGAAAWRIGTTEATVLSVEDGSGAGLAGWGWTDNGYGVLGPLVTFSTGGLQTIRIQQREDGVSLDQVILSPSTFLSVAPGATQNDSTIYAKGLPPPPPPPTDPPPCVPVDIVLHTRNAAPISGGWQRVSDATAAGGTRLWIPDAAVPKLTQALAQPAHYFELTFEAVAGVPYRLWFRGRADGDLWTNDSVFAQFTNSVTPGGAAAWRIGTTDATVLSVEQGSGAGLAGWGWADNGYGMLGPLVTFSTSGPQTIRIQSREDGLSIDQIVLSPQRYLTTAPGLPKNDATIYTNAPAPPPTDPPPGGPVDVVLHARTAALISGLWQRVSDATAAGGTRLWIPDAAVPKLALALAQPAHYFELTFDAVAGVPYRLWFRGRADGDLWTNDSAFVQFTNSVTGSGAPVWRIGTTDATVLSVEEGSGAGLSGWGWADNGYGTLGPLVTFSTSGPQTIRIQSREDGLSIDQIVLSPQRYLTTAPGLTKADTTIVR